MGQISNSNKLPPQKNAERQAAYWHNEIKKWRGQRLRRPDASQTYAKDPTASEVDMKDYKRWYWSSGKVEPGG